MRPLDTFDYLLVCGMSVLAYLQLPWRPQIRESLRSGVALVSSFEPSAEVVIVTLALLGALVLFLLVEVLPGRHE
ncbi:hypothetical protein SAMN04487949_3234 [Halogranum gelatinilyticum]|uniref:Uncharacterized protein n=1 Tax=Halogranum gelatinilyticum TaxID=660521 RepID=A0A1G9Y2B3_9EURY|nr:hypothetical protein [Halogranum gelatinilyticum]SDN03198.1 hypothetical protein SAMN04487949_3234 [Halogranum gelatinilyticum]